MHYLVSELKKGETYHLRYGAGDVPAPVYDMQYFPDNIPDSMTVLQPSGRTEISMKLEEKTAKQDAEEETKTVFTHRGYIWAAIVIVILLLGVLSFRMLRGMGEK
jgi:hypothetical protein